MVVSTQVENGNAILQGDGVIGPSPDRPIAFGFEIGSWLNEEIRGDTGFPHHCLQINLTARLILTHINPTI